MQNAITKLPGIRERISKAGCILMLDFDGTLSPLVRTPDEASLSSRTQGLLQKISARVPVAIISGRPLADVRKRVGIRGISYAGNHGCEWQMGERRYRRALSPLRADALGEAKKSLLRLCDIYPELIVEDKSYSIALNYRSLPPRKKRLFRREARVLAGPYIEKGLRLMDSRYTFEVLADTGWNKGDFARLMQKRIHEKSGLSRVPIYIGDSLTDEDVFRTMPEGVTIRVGKKTTSAAHYFLSRRTSIDTFLKEIADADYPLVASQGKTTQRSQSSAE